MFFINIYCLISQAICMCLSIQLSSNALSSTAALLLPACFPFYFPISLLSLFSVSGFLFLLSGVACLFAWLIAAKLPIGIPVSSRAATPGTHTYTSISIFIYIYLSISWFPSGCYQVTNGNHMRHGISLAAMSLVSSPGIWFSFPSSPLPPPLPYNSLVNRFSMNYLFKTNKKVCILYIFIIYRLLV